MAFRTNTLHTIQDLDAQLVTNEKTNRTLALILLLLSSTLTTWAILLQVPRMAELLTYYDEMEDLSQSDNVSMSGNDSAVVSCYYSIPNLTLHDSQLMPSDIHPHLCTHINIAFARIKDKQIYIEESQHKIILEIVKLKEINPNLKILLSIGGAGGDSGFPDMVINHMSRKTFIRSIKYTLRYFSLDGVDLDWEFPAIGYKNKLTKRERQHFSQLLREIRMEYIREKKNYLLTVAIAAPQIIVDAAYDVDQINMYVDFANIMTYDFHSYTSFTPLTGLNSPLYSRPEEQLYMATLNINYTVEMYKQKGLDSKKIVVGIPTYGHTFTLVNNKNTKVGSPSLGFGTLGSLGFVNYPDICSFINKFKNETTIKLEHDAKVPYFYRNSEWVSYDNPDSVKEKAEYIRNNNLRGAMIYSLNADDYNGICDNLLGTTKFPLAVSIKNALDDTE